MIIGPGMIESFNYESFCLLMTIYFNIKKERGNIIEPAYKQMAKGNTGGDSAFGIFRQISLIAFLFAKPDFYF